MVTLTARQALAEVLIPLISGLVFGQDVARVVPLIESLNPFDFRAGIWSAKAAAVLATLRLNPFDFRAGIWSQTDLYIPPTT